MIVRNQHTTAGYAFKVVAERNGFYVVMLPNGNLSMVSKSEYAEVKDAKSGHDDPL